MVDGRLPVLVGAGQVTSRGEPTSAPMLMEDAARAAVEDAGSKVRGHIDSIQVVNSLSAKDPSLAAVLARRIGLPDGERVQSTVGGSTPQGLVATACDRIASGELDGVLIVGAEALHSIRRGDVPADPPGEPQEPDGIVGDDRTPFGPADLAARLVAPTTVYALFESVLASRAGRTPDEHRRWLGDLMAPFTSVAARLPDLAWFRTERTPEEISVPTADNRLVGEPYTKRMNAVLRVDQGAAILLLSASAAEAAGVPSERWVFPLSAAGCDDVYFASERLDLGASPALEVAGHAALASAGIAIEDVTFLDLYSCFPSAVQVGAAALGIDPFDERGLTVTGGLPYFGGPGSNYVTHALATMAGMLREEPEAIGLVTGISWYLSKHAVGLYSATPPPGGWRHADCGQEEARIASMALPVALEASGEAVAEAMTVEHDHRGPAHAPVLARLSDGRRVAAVAATIELVRELSGRSLVGERIVLRPGDGCIVYEPA